MMDQNGKFFFLLFSSIFYKWGSLVECVAVYMSGVYSELNVNATVLDRCTKYMKHMKYPSSRCI